MKHLRFIVKEDRGYKGLSRLLFLLFQHGVETADGVALQPLHGAAAIQDETNSVIMKTLLRLIALPL